MYAFYARFLLENPIVLLPADRAKFLEGLERDKLGEIKFAKIDHNDFLQESLKLFALARRKR